MFSFCPPLCVIVCSWKILHYTARNITYNVMKPCNIVLPGSGYWTESLFTDIQKFRSWRFPDNTKFINEKSTWVSWGSNQHVQVGIHHSNNWTHQKWDTILYLNLIQMSNMTFGSVTITLLNWLSIQYPLSNLKHCTAPLCIC